MKRAKDGFVSVNPNSPRKKRQKKLNTYDNAISFSSTGTSESATTSGSAHSTPNENQPAHPTIPTLGSPWAPLPNFRTWDYSKQTQVGSDFRAAQDRQIPTGYPSTPSESPPILLRFGNTANTLGQTPDSSHFRVYEPPRIAPHSAWRECK